MSTLDLQILEELGMKRYLSMTYLAYRFSDNCRCYLAKRLKKMLDDGLIGRQAALEPLTQHIEYIYFLDKQGVENLMASSTKFASVAEIDMPKTFATITHDTALTWLQTFLMRDKEKYLNESIAEMNWESRRSQVALLFPEAGIVPDAIFRIKMRQATQTKTYLIEVDNSTETLNTLRQKFICYREYLAHHHDYILIVAIQHSEKRLEFLVRLAGKVITARHAVFACTLPEISTFGIFSNIWTSPATMSSHKNSVLHHRNFSDRDRFYLPL
jgi:hypothetical protein